MCGPEKALLCWKRASGNHFCISKNRSGNNFLFYCLEELSDSLSTLSISTSVSATAPHHQPRRRHRFSTPRGLPYASPHVAPWCASSLGARLGAGPRREAVQQRRERRWMTSKRDVRCIADSSAPRWVFTGDRRRHRELHFVAL